MVEMQNEKWFIAAYYPAGNQVDQYIDNVGRPKTGRDYILRICFVIEFCISIYTKNIYYILLLQS